VGLDLDDAASGLLHESGVLVDEVVNEVVLGEADEVRGQDGSSAALDLAPGDGQRAARPVAVVDPARHVRDRQPAIAAAQVVPISRHAARPSLG